MSDTNDLVLKRLDDFCDRLERVEDANGKRFDEVLRLMREIRDELRAEDRLLHGKHSGVEERVRALEQGLIEQRATVAAIAAQTAGLGAARERDDHERRALLLKVAGAAVAAGGLGGMGGAKALLAIFGG